MNSGQDLRRLAQSNQLMEANLNSPKLKRLLALRTWEPQTETSLDLGQLPLTLNQRIEFRGSALKEPP